MTKVTFEMEPEQVDAIIVQELQWHLETMEKDLENRKNNTGMAIFSTDKDEDIVCLQEHIKSFSDVLKYYTA